MQLYYDFHIHSTLSPCASEDMTPNNIVNMARLKGLDAISVCDHNCAANLEAVAEVAQKTGVLFLPGLEVNTAEEVHLLAYFNEVRQACDFGDMVYDALPDVKNNEDYFGSQIIMDSKDRVKGKMDKLLISALPFSLEESVRMIAEYGGCAVPAHINREANSLLNNLGFLPPDINFKTLEVMPGKEAEGVDLYRYHVLNSSDAHFLEDISEKEHTILVNNKSVFSIFNALF